MLHPPTWLYTCKTLPSQILQPSFFLSSSSRSNKVSVQYTSPTFRMTSNETVLTVIQNLTWRFDDLREEVHALKSEHSSRRHLAGDCGSSSTLREWSRSPHCCGESSHHTDTPRSWASQMERNLEECPDYSASLPLLDASEQADDEDGPDLAKVSEKTAQFLITACSWSLSNENRKQSRSCFPLSKVPWQDASTWTPLWDQKSLKRQKLLIRSQP